MTAKRRSGVAVQTVEDDRIGDEGPGGGVRVRGLPAARALPVGIRRRPIAPAREVAAVEEAFEPFLGCEGIGDGLDEPERSEDGPQGGCPSGVTGLVGVEQVGELGGNSVAVRIGEERPGLEVRDLGVVLDARPGRGR